MNDLLPDPVPVQAPVGALAWSASRGFIDDLDELTEARLEGELVLDVTDHRPAGVVEDVEGDAPLAIAVRHDRELADLRRVLARVLDRLGAAQ